MDFYAMIDTGIGEGIGHRIKRLRLRKNMMQVELSKATKLSLNATKSLEGEL